jgi:hypothetical protein
MSGNDYQEQTKLPVTHVLYQKIAFSETIMIMVAWNGVVKEGGKFIGA